MSSRKQSGSNQMKLDTVSESDIENLWLRMTKASTKSKPNSTSKRKNHDMSLDTTPTTNYSEGLFPLHPESLEEELEEDEKMNQMNSTLRAKRQKPKSYLPQVILHDNVSHDRLLAMRLTEIQQSHHKAERRAKRRQESFVKSLERKQESWKRRDARVMAKLEPENLSEFNFTFGRLYTKPDYPYQSVIEKLSIGELKQKAMDHARRRPTLLPQVTNRPIFDDEEPEDKTFITRLPKLKNLPPLSDDTHTVMDNFQRSINKNAPTFPGPHTDRGAGRRRKRGEGKGKRKDWTADVRFHTLTSLLGERYSPRSQRKKNHSSEQPTVMSSTI
ncbi:uncharacterized protein LOC143471320 [Clavelina lepadiformis]|uniref:uncharacterized protein LOC143471320 n=1 Tax=Clavelina lepadiformis TaxID=159417 RepID=UPI004041F197